MTVDSKLKGLAVVVLDMQPAYVNDLKKSDRKNLISSHDKFLSKMEKTKVPIYGIFCTTEDELHIPEIHKYVNSYGHKSSDSMFESMDVIEWLEDNFIDKIILTGLNANSCIASSVIHNKFGDLPMHKFKMYTSKDLIGQGTDSEGNYLPIDNVGLSTLFDEYYSSTKQLLNNFLK